MAIELASGFFNAIMQDGEPDRTYNCDDLNEFLKGLVSENGIYAEVSNACQVIPSSGMNVVVKTGKGQIGFNWFEIESDTTLEIANSDVVLNRIDRVVIQRSLTNRNTVLYIKQGTLASNPTPPALTRNESVYEIALADILISKNISAITTTYITDQRSNNNVCGWIVGLIEQFDTTTLFNQYQEAQDDFINNQTQSFEEWYDSQIQIFNQWYNNQTQSFNDWFNNIKDEVKATNLYREYRSLYATVNTNEQDIQIPSTILFDNNGLDVLEVIINGLVANDNQYSISDDGTSIHLTSPLSVIGTRVEFVNKKSVEGTVAESTVLRVEALEKKVNDNYNCCYDATGENDNVKLSNMVKDFLNGVGNYAGVQDTSCLYVKVCDVLGITSTIDEHVFDFNSTATTNRRVIVDFSSATIPLINLSGNIAIMSCTDHVSIKHANIKATKRDGQTMYGFYGGHYDDCNIIIDCANTKIGTCYGAWGCKDVSNSEIYILNASNTSFAIYQCDKVLFNTLLSNTLLQIKLNGKKLMVGNFLKATGGIQETLDSDVTEIGTITQNTLD